MKTNRVSLDQWQTLVAVVEAGSYARAAARLHKSQSSVTYALQKLEHSLDVAVFRLQGRKAVLTDQGRVLYRRARTLIDDARRLERGALKLAAGVESSLRLAVEILFPTWMLLQSLDRFAARFPDTRLDLTEAVLGGTDEALIERRADLVVGTSIPQGFSGDALMRIRIIPVAHPQHALHRMGRELTLEDLRAHRQLVVRDTATGNKRDSGGWLGAEQRWTVSHKATSISAACMGLGFAWYAEEMIRRELDAGHLKALPMRMGAERFETLYLVLAEPEFAGPALLHLAERIREDASNPQITPRGLRI